MLTQEDKVKIADWFGSRDTGLSSETLVITALCEHPPMNSSYPHDCSDFGRCQRLLEMVPNVRKVAFSILEERGSAWPKLIADWDAISESPTYEKIRSVLGA